MRCRGPGSRPLLGPPYLHREFGSQPISSFPAILGQALTCWPLPLSRDLSHILPPWGVFFVSLVVLQEA